MTLSQCGALIAGVLRGWFPNKRVLDKFSEGNAGLLYNGQPVFYEDDEDISSDDMADAISETISDLNESLQPSGNTWGVQIGLAPMPTEQAGAANNDTVKSVVMSGLTTTIKVDLNNLIAFPSSDSGQGTHKWLCVEVYTGKASIIGVSYNGYALTQQDVDDAEITGCSLGSFVLYIKAEEVLNTPKVFTLSAANSEDIQLTIRVVNE